MSRPQVQVVWFKRDLRTADHPALTRAAGMGRPVLPVYVAEPGLWAEPDASARQWAFIAESILSENRAPLPSTTSVLPCGDVPKGKKTGTGATPALYRNHGYDIAF